MEIESVTYEKLLEKIKKFIKDEEDLKKIEEAYLFAKKNHEGKFRDTNEEYITHPLAVCDIVLDLNPDVETVICALIHETINHGEATKEEIEQKFGSEVANIVSIISRINKLALTDDSESSAIYLRKVLVGLASDVRILFIKLADRLHNMRTIWAVSKEEQKRKVHETQSVLIPIAHRLGINSIKSELENLCLKYSKPDVYQAVLDELDADYEQLNDYLNEMKESIGEILAENNIKYEIKGRVKSVHSIYNKLSNGKKFKDIHDILALRVFVEKESDCYLVIGLIHAKYRPVPNRFKDYIAMPKENMYQSLHTTVFGRDGYHFEIQVRTYEMDEIAEKGMAAHWTYKEHGSVKIQKMMEQKLEMFRNLIEANKEGNDEDFASSVKSEILAEMIYVFTPKGDVVELPKDATVIDFAYRIHSDVGDKMVGAIVNESIVPLDYKLQDKDIVKINTSPTSTPSQEWLKIVKTAQAKNKIKSFFSKQYKTKYIEDGKTLLEREMRRKKLTFNEVLNESKLKKVLTDLKLNSLDDLYLAIGSLRYTSTYIINLASEDKKNVADSLMLKLRKDNAKYSYKNDVIVDGISDIKVNLAKCCKPVLGDEIIGYVTKGEGVTVHLKTCKNILDKKRLIDVRWNEAKDNQYETGLKITTLFKTNALLDIVTKASLRNIVVKEVKNKEIEGAVIYTLIVKVKSKEDLDSFITDLNNFSFVQDVKRY